MKDSWYILFCHIHFWGRSTTETTMPTLVVTSQKGPFESDTVDLNAEQQKAYDTALSVSHGSALVIRGTVPGCGITTLAARLAAADPTGFETISVRALLGGNDRSEFSGKFGAKTLPACTTRIIFHDAEEVLAEAVDELYRHFDAK